MVLVNHETTLPPHYSSQGNFLLIYLQNSTILLQEDRKAVLGVQDNLGGRVVLPWQVG